MIHKRLSIVGITGLIGLSSLLGAGPAQAREPGEQAEPPRVELVLDVSGSMRAADIDGETRIAVAKRAFNEVVDALPETTYLGIRVLGATYPGDNKKTGCKDTQQIVEVGPVDRNAAKDAIAGLKPTGFTPVGLALREAAKDLGDSGSVRRIVLITDGEDTCTPPDPCAVARELAAQGTKLVVDTLGLAPDEKTRKQLVCISTATGGTFTAAQSQEELTDRVKQLVDRAAVPPPVAPAAVTGAEDCQSAPLLAPGVYTDREKIGEHRYYRVPVQSGQELRASVSVALDRQVSRDYGVLMKAATADGRELVRGSDAGSGRADVLSAGLRWSGDEEPSPQASDDADDGEQKVTTDVCLIVSNSFASNTAASAPGMPLELSIDVVDASHTPDAPGLGRGWLLLLVLGLAGLVAGVLAGWLTRWWVATWRDN
ncbi:VWA domain-containing protein [Winogradskya consettensis]|uniref:VWA domain-containing protein n=1 Tax=Winogradskya consettensis TaxID=113560 RepID=UPI001BB329D5|nr:VWA domain-containing protein [Actinoplanes consettensis]